MERLHPDLERAKIFFLISGIINILIMLGWGRSFFVHSFPINGFSPACGMGCFTGFLPLLNAACCVMDFISYAKLNGSHQKGLYNTIKTAAVLEILTILTRNILSLIFGIITLVSISKDEMIAYVKEKGIF